VETGGLSGGFAPLPITGGVTDKPPAAGKVDAACWSETVLRVKAHDIGIDTPFTLGDTGHAALACLTYVGPTAAADLDRPEELDSTAGTAAWSRLGCALGDLRTATSDSLTAWEFWAGRLPESGPAARWICVRGEMADGRNAAFGQFAPTEPAPVQATGAVLGSRLCGPLSRDLAATTWWRAVRPVVPAGRRQPQRAHHRGGAGYGARRRPRPGTARPVQEPAGRQGHRPGRHRHRRGGPGPGPRRPQPLTAPASRGVTPPAFPASVHEGHSLRQKPHIDP